MAQLLVTVGLDQQIETMIRITRYLFFCFLNDLSIMLLELSKENVSILVT